VTDRYKSVEPELDRGNSRVSELIQAVKFFAAEWPAARAYWSERDPRLFAVTPAEPVDRIIEVLPTPFGALVRAIMHQQVSIYAGRSILTRLVAACDGGLEPGRVLALSDGELQQVGLSRSKIRYVRALAEAVGNGLLAEIEHQPDDEIARRLVTLPGVGQWTVQMFLLFHLRRPDVFSGHDLGLREGIQVLDARDRPITATEAEERAEVWRPYRSVAAIVLWDLVRRTREERPRVRGAPASSPDSSVRAAP
jgi:DNA-3-methyladenine glycosylase II